MTTIEKEDKGMATKTRKDVRELKVCAVSGYRYQAVPQIQLKGAWLREFGFEAETPVLVRCEDGKLIITPDRARIEAEAQQKEYLDREMAALNARYATEKKKIYRQMVAERSNWEEN